MSRGVAKISEVTFVLLQSASMFFGNFIFWQHASCTIQSGFTVHLKNIYRKDAIVLNPVIKTGGDFVNVYVKIVWIYVSTFGYLILESSH